MNFADIERGVRKLQPTVRETDHRIFLVVCTCGTLLGRTKVSRKASDTVGKAIASSIPRQLNIPRSLWAEIAGCSKGRGEYLAHFGHAGH
jgi:hypothetical protein